MGVNDDDTWIAPVVALHGATLDQANSEADDGVEGDTVPADPVWTATARYMQAVHTWTGGEAS